MDKVVDFSFFCGKKVFVTGHTGFKGSWLCQILLDANAKVFGYSLAPSTSPNLFEQLSLKSKMISVIDDVRNLDSLKKALTAAQPDIVFHLAAQPLVRESYLNPVDTYEINVIGTANLLEACRTVPSIKTIINITTDKVYENKEWEWGYRENENLCGLDPYSNSKSCSELVTYSYKNSFYNSPESPSISTARSGNVIGGGDFSKDRIIPDCVRDTIKGQQIKIRNPYSTRPYQHVLDCLSGYLQLAKLTYQDKSFVGSYNFGPNESDCVSTGKLVDMFCANWPSASWLHCGEKNAPHEANFLKLDISKAKNQLSWRPTWGIETALKKTVNWYRAYAANENLIAITDKQIEEFFYNE